MAKAGARGASPRDRAAARPLGTSPPRTGGRTKQNKHNNQPVGKATGRRGWVGVAGGVGEKGGSGTRGTGGEATRTRQRRRAPRASPPPFPRERRWRSPGLFLSSREEVRMDPGPGGRAGGKGGEWGDGGNRDADGDKEETPRGLFRLLFLWRRRRRSPGLLLSCIFRRSCWAWIHISL